MGQIPGEVWEYTNTSVTYDMVQDTHGTDDTYSQDSWSHVWGQIPELIWECTNTFVTCNTIQGPAADDDGVRARRKNECVPHGII